MQIKVMHGLPRKPVIVSFSLKPNNAPPSLLFTRDLLFSCSWFASWRRTFPLSILTSLGRSYEQSQSFILTRHHCYFNFAGYGDNPLVLLLPPPPPLQLASLRLSHPAGLIITYPYLPPGQAFCSISIHSPWRKHYTLSTLFHSPTHLPTYSTLDLSKPAFRVQKIFI